MPIELSKESVRALSPRTSFRDASAKVSCTSPASVKSLSSRTHRKTVNAIIERLKLALFKEAKSNTTFVRLALSKEQSSHNEVSKVTLVSLAPEKFVNVRS